MSHEVSWPPLSPHAALLSSPSGRKKYANMLTSPQKRSGTSSKLLERLRTARDQACNETGQDSEEDAGDDEEILQLKLAAIGAKLRLKKLQKSKAKTSSPTKALSRPNSSHGSNYTTLQSCTPHAESETKHSQVEISLSPARRNQPAPQPKSPSRVRLGIDKGVRAADVSLLRRANTSAGTTRRTDHSSLSGHARPSSRVLSSTTARSSVAKPSFGTEDRKTFSERMAEVRNKESSIRTRREEIAKSRSKEFDVDKVEVEKYRLEAEQVGKMELNRSPLRVPHQDYSREDIAQALDQIRHLKKSRTMPDLRLSPSRSSSSRTESGEGSTGDATLYEGFSQLHLSSRILPHSFLKRTLSTEKYTIYRVPDLLREVTSPSFELPDSICDFVVCAVIASKSGAMDHKKPPPENNVVASNKWEQKWEDGSQNQKRFMAFTLTDLKWTVDLYLFGTALPRYHRLMPGTVIAILNPGIMPPKPGKEDTGAFSLSLAAGEDTILEIGTARDLGHCKTLKKDGKKCGSWVDTSKTTICEWHLNAELNKTQAGRMGVNTGTNGFGKGLHGGRGGFNKGTGRWSTGRGLLDTGPRYDQDSHSHFYVAKSNAYPTGLGTQAKQGNGNNHHFGGEGQLDRDKDVRMRKHFAVQAKEREIAKKLGSMNHNHGFDSAGAEYLRHRAHAAESGKDTQRGKSRSLNLHPSSTPPASEADLQAGSQGSTLVSRSNFVSSSSVNAHGKRVAADVKLSPVKKTRFVTDRGIREAGRESLGVQGKGGDHHSEDSEDELEIV